MDSNGELVPPEVEHYPGWHRLNDRLFYYDRLASKNEKSFTRARGVEIVLAALIPIFSLAETEWSKWVSATLGAIIAILVGLRQLWNSDTKWMEYSTLAEELKREKNFFLTASGPYRHLHTSDALKLLTERTETIMDRQQQNFVWVTRSSS
jgi:hypothetical protein